MGDIANMMLDGTLCEACGEYMGSDSGYPNYCSEECARDRGMTLEDGIPVARQDTPPRRKIVPCPDCGKKCRGDGGVMQHQNAKHDSDWTHNQINSVKPIYE